jgi:hypothetical protein
MDHVTLFVEVDEAAEGLCDGIADLLLVEWTITDLDDVSNRSHRTVLHQYPQFISALVCVCWVGKCCDMLRRVQFDVHTHPHPHTRHTDRYKPTHTQTDTHRCIQKTRHPHPHLPGTTGAKVLDDVAVLALPQHLELLDQLGGGIGGVVWDHLDGQFELRGDMFAPVHTGERTLSDLVQQLKGIRSVPLPLQIQIHVTFVLEPRRRTDTPVQSHHVRLLLLLLLLLPVLLLLVFDLLLLLLLIFGLLLLLAFGSADVFGALGL